MTLTDAGSGSVHLAVAIVTADAVGMNAGNAVMTAGTDGIVMTDAISDMNLLL